MNTKELLSKPEINFFLSILIPLLALAVAWGNITIRVDTVERTAAQLQVKQEIQQDVQAKTNEEIKIKLAEIQKDILYIRQSLDSHDNNGISGNTTNNY